MATKVVGGFILDPSFSAKIGRRKSDAIGTYASVYVSVVKDLMENSPATGRIYGSGLNAHQASAPGQPPAPWSRELIDSIAIQQVALPSGNMSTTIVVSPKAMGYVKALELGTANMFPRRAWQPALSILRSMKVTLPPIVAA